VTEDQNDRCHQYAAAVGISETNPAMKQLHSEHPWDHNLAAARSDPTADGENKHITLLSIQPLSFLSQSELSKVPVAESSRQPCNSDSVQPEGCAQTSAWLDRSTPLSRRTVRLEECVLGVADDALIEANRARNVPY